MIHSAKSGIAAGELTGLKRFLHLKVRFGLSRLPLFPVRYRLRTPGCPDMTFAWSKVMPFMDPAKGAFDFDLWGWDVRELRFLRRFLATGMTVMDIGAHHGLYSILAARCVGPAGRIFALEPAPPACRRLRWHLMLNGARAVEVRAVAVGAIAGTGRFHIPTKGVDTISSLRPSQLGPRTTRAIDVNVVTLDELATGEELERLDLVKLDVEGGESDVLDGSRSTIQRFRPLWMFEALDVTSSAWGQSGRALVERMAASGHAVFEFTPDGLLSPHLPRDNYPLQSNCNLLAVPVEKAALVAPLIDALAAGNSRP